MKGSNYLPAANGSTRTLTALIKTESESVRSKKNLISCSQNFSFLFAPFIQATFPNIAARVVSIQVQTSPFLCCAGLSAGKSVPFFLLRCGRMVLFRPKAAGFSPDRWVSEIFPCPGCFSAGASFMGEGSRLDPRKPCACSSEEKKSLCVAKCGGTACNRFFFSSSTNED